MTNFDFFVSYTRTDAAWAEWIAWQLEATGKRVVIQSWDFCPAVTRSDAGDLPPDRRMPLLPSQAATLPHCLFCGIAKTRVGPCEKCHQIPELDDSATMRQCKACSEWTPLAGPYCGHCGNRLGH